ncbi:MAG: putative Ig domain-containing protein, partial [Terracidiphilus sp.]
GYTNAPGSYPFTVEVTDPQGNTGSQDYTLTVYPDITVLPPSLPAGTVGTAYSQQLTASGGAGGPYSFSVISGTALSAVGLTLSPGGLISGTPSTTETAAALLIKVADSQGYYTEFNYPLTVNAATSTPAQVTDNETITVTDAETFPDVVDSEPITVTDAEVVRAYNPFAITPTPASFNAASGNGYATYAYSVPFTATGGIGTLTLTETGALPTGVTFINGVLGGTPVASSVGNTYTFSVTATDADGDSITVPGYSLTILAASAYPAMVTDNETITVTDTETFPDVSDSETITVTDKVLVTANSPLAIAGPASLPAGELNVAYPATTFSASGGSGAYTWSATGLPAGLTMSPGGVLSGTPNSAGVFATTVTVLDSSANTNSVIFSLSVASPSLGISASPTTLTIAQGKSGQITITFTPVGGYSGTVTLSCSGLPANTLCVFTLNGAAIKSYTFPGNNQPVSVVLTIETDVSALARTEPAPTPQRPGAIMTAIAFWCPGSLLGVIVLRRKRKLFTKNPSTFGLCLFVLLVGAIAGLAGCISGGGFGTYVTPTGTSTVTVVVTPGSGSAQTLNIGVTVTQ